MATTLIIRRTKRSTTRGTAMPSVKEEGSRFIDTKIPVTWLLSSLAMVFFVLVGTTWNFASQLSASNQKMDSMIAGFAELKVAQKDRDTKYDLLRESLFTTQRVVDAHELRLNALERLPPSSTSRSAR